MSAVPQKIRWGLVELRTRLGSVYVSPSFWERIYLLWTFRNFHSLPKQVLNQHQQQLIDKLWRAAIVNQNVPIAKASIIGVVENVNLIPGYKTETAATAGKLIEMSTTSADLPALRAVGSEASSIRSNRAAYKRQDVGKFNRQSGDVQYISLPKQGSTQEASLVESGSRANRLWRQNEIGWALVSGGCAVLLGISFYFRADRLTPSIARPPVSIEAHEPVPRSVPSAVAAQTEKFRQSVSVEHRQPATIIAVQPATVAASSTQRKSGRHKTAILTLPRIATMDSSPGERLQVEEPPKSGFSYPAAPNPTLTGKVSLKAVIGADGSVKTVDVLSGNRVLASAAAQAVRHWHYRRHELKGHAVDVETNIAISFMGDDAVSVSFPAAH